jgi:DNA invertase Pin-like site-specific DNA recombinase
MKQKKNRTRPIQIIFHVSERERDLIHQKMEMLKTKNQSAYIRKMAIDGYILKVDFTEFKKMFADIGRIGGSINQIAKRVNATHNIYAEDITELKERQGEVWRLLKSTLSKLPL